MKGERYPTLSICGAKRHTTLSFDWYVGLTNITADIVRPLHGQRPLAGGFARLGGVALSEPRLNYRTVSSHMSRLNSYLFLLVISVCDLEGEDLDSWVSWMSVVFVSLAILVV